MLLDYGLQVSGIQVAAKRSLDRLRPAEKEGLPVITPRAAGGGGGGSSYPWGSPGVIRALSPGHARNA